MGGLEAHPPWSESLKVPSPLRAKHSEIQNRCLLQKPFPDVFCFFVFLTVVRLLGQPAEAELTAACDAETCVFSPATVQAAPEQALECGAVQADPGPVSSTEPSTKPEQVPKNLIVLFVFFCSDKFQYYRSDICGEGEKTSGTAPPSAARERWASPWKQGGPHLGLVRLCFQRCQCNCKAASICSFSFFFLFFQCNCAMQVCR